MSYYTGISKEELLEEGWTDEQIAELRAVEDKIRQRKKKEWFDAQEKWRKEWDDLGPWGQKALNRMWLSSSYLSTPPEAVIVMAKQEGLLMEQRHMEHQIRLANKKWWQFWIK